MKLKLLDHGTGTLFAQVFALILAAVVGAQGINLWIFFHLPPPAPNFYTEADVMRALHGQPRQGRGNGPPLIVQKVAGALQIDPDSRIGFSRFRGLMADDLGLTVNDVVVITEGGDRLTDGAQVTLPADAAKMQQMGVAKPKKKPGLFAGGLLAFTLSLDDFVITFFTSGPDTTTFPVKVYSMIRFSVTPEVNAASTLLIVITVALTAIALRLQGSEGVKAGAPH